MSAIELAYRTLRAEAARRLATRADLPPELRAAVAECQHGEPPGEPCADEPHRHLAVWSNLFQLKSFLGLGSSPDEPERRVLDGLRGLLPREVSAVSLSPDAASKALRRLEVAALAIDAAGAEVRADAEEPREVLGLLGHALAVCGDARRSIERAAQAPDLRSRGG